MNGLSLTAKLFAIQAATLLAWIGVGVFQRPEAPLEIRFGALCVVAVAIGAALRLTWPVSAELTFAKKKVVFYGVFLFVNVVVAGWVALACWLLPEPAKPYLDTLIWGGIYLCPVLLLGLLIAAAGDE